MKKREIKKRVSALLFCALASAAIYWDFTQAGKVLVTEGVFRPESEFAAITGATTKVAIVPSDYETLPNPTPISNAQISYQQVEDMVREALQLQGGLQWLIKPGDKVLIKPNIVDPEPPGSGEVTDVRVVKALIKIIAQATNNQASIIIGEGSPREMDYELPYSSAASPDWQELWDVAGYQELLIDPDLQGIPFSLVNLNGSPPQNPWQDLVLVDVPGGGVAAPQGGKYWVHKEVLDADVFITCPVLKTHKAGLTCALKNQIGIAPSTKYGFPKTGGVPQDNYAFRLIHRADLPRDWVDEEIVDLCSIAEIDLVVVDAIAALEEGKEAIRDEQGNVTNLVRFNTIVAGIDPVAVDHVCAKIIGLNPDDVAHICLAEKVGLGTNDPDLIEVSGRSIEQIKKPLKKDPYFTSDYGQSNRTWLLSQTFSTAGISNPMAHTFIANEALAEPIAGQDGWSEAMYFFDDRIDLGSYYGGPTNVVAYAFSYFDSPTAQTAELWLGSDEALRIYLNGQIVYDYNGTRSYRKERIVSEKISVQLQQGENTLLVKALQKYGEFDFALNICEPEADPDLDGNRVAGLTFYTETQQASSVRLALPDTTATPGQTLDVPVRLQQLGGISLGECRFAVTYDPAVVQPSGVITEGSLSATGSTVISDFSVPGEFVVILTSDPPLQSTGTLLFLRFSVSASGIDTTQLHFKYGQANSGAVASDLVDGRIVVQTYTAPTVSFTLLGENSGSLWPGATNQLIAGFTAQTDVGTASFNALRLKLIGTCLITDVARMAICRDNGDGVFSPADDPRIGYNRFQSQTTLVRFASAEVIEQTPKRYFIVADIAGTVSDPSSTFGIEITSNTSFDVTAPAVVNAGALPFQSVQLGLPVELAAFQAVSQGEKVLLSWVTASEINNLRFDVERSYDGNDFTIIASVPGRGTTTQEHSYRFEDTTPKPGEYFYRLRQIDFSGDFSLSDPIRVTVTPPRNLALWQNYPNPFNQSTAIAFDLPEAKKVSVEVYSIEGRLVRQISSGLREAGRHSLHWDGRDENGRSLPSGIYLLLLRAGESTLTQKASLVR